MNTIARQTGFSLVPALFLIVVLSVLATVAVRLSSTQHQTVLLAMQSARAYAAAQAGIEWSAYEAIVNANCSSSTLSLAEGGLSGFSVDTSCSNTSHGEGANTINVYVIESFARGGIYGTPDYVSRRVRATLTDAT